MSSLNVSKMLLNLIGVAMLLPVIGFAQGQERVINKLSWRTEPIKILKLKTKGKPIELGKNFLEEDDWLKGLTVTVQNVSDKPIARIVLDLSFPRPEGTSETISTFSEKLVYGLDPSDAQDAGAQKQVLPGESVDVKLLEANLPFIKAALVELGYPEKITRARIMVEFVTFTDGTAWNGGDILYPDPTDPKRKFNPKVPLIRPIPPDRSALPSRPPLLLFQNASLQSTYAPAILNNENFPLWKFLLLQDPTLPCNTVFVTTQHLDCGTGGSGCTYSHNVFDDSIELLGLRDARKDLETVLCKKSDGTTCSPNLISNFKRSPSRRSDCRRWVRPAGLQHGQWSH